MDTDFRNNSYYKEIRNIPILTADEERDLFLRYKNPDYSVSKAARDKLIESNLRLVCSIAVNYLDYDVSFDDVYSVGCLGLIRGIEKFDVSRGFKFSTYATWWIKQFITRYIYLDSNIIKIPIYVSEKIDKLLKTEEEFVKKYQRVPSYVELARIMDISIYELSEIFSLMQEPLSLSMPINNDEDLFLSDLLSTDDDVVNDEVDNRLLNSDIYRIFNELGFSQDAIDILTLKLGFDGKGEKTLQEIADIYNISHQAVRSRLTSYFDRISNNNKAMRILSSYCIPNKCKKIVKK